MGTRVTEELPRPRTRKDEAVSEKYPTPWRTEREDHWSTSDILDANGVSIVDCVSNDVADLIIRAVNAHEALVSALENEHAETTAYRNNCPACCALDLARGEVKP